MHWFRSAAGLNDRLIQYVPMSHAAPLNYSVCSNSIQFQSSLYLVTLKFRNNFTDCTNVTYIHHVTSQNNCVVGLCGAVLWVLELECTKHHKMNVLQVYVPTKPHKWGLVGMYYTLIQNSINGRNLFWFMNCTIHRYF